MSDLLVAWDHRHSTNFGDHAVTEGVLALLTEAGHTVRGFLSPTADATYARGVKLAYGGGEHLHSRPDLAHWLRPLLDATHAIVLPSTFGPFDPADHDLVKRAMERHPVAARDPESADIIGAILGRDVPVLADPALFLPLPARRVGKYRLLVPRREDAGMRAGPGPKVHPRRTEAFGRYLAEWASWQPAAFVAHSKHDVALCRALSDATRSVWLRPPSLDWLLELYAQSSMVITSRYHGALFARMLGKRLTTIPWDVHGHKWSGVPTDVETFRAETLAWVRAALA